MSATVPEIAALRLIETIDAARPALDAIDDVMSAQRPRPERWSAREELGHLIDSAFNNHRRVVLGHLQNRLDFEGYDGDGWVAAHNYKDAAWRDIVALWAMANRHLARAVAHVPPDVYTRSHEAHTMGAIGFRSYAAGQSASLSDLVDDYIDHLEHHLAAIRRTVTAIRSQARS